MAYERYELTSAGNYSWAFRYLPEKLSLIIEVGSRDALDAIELSSHFDSNVIAFEADPRQQLVCQKNLSELDSHKVEIRSEALLDSDGVVDFWQVDTSKYSNTGIGSLYQVNFSNRSTEDPDAMHAGVQHRISVTGRRFDSLSLPSPELLVMDVQGSELKVLQGFGEKLLEVDFVILEAEEISSYVGGSTFGEVHKHLSDLGFKLVATDLFGKGIFRLLISNKLQGIQKFVKGKKFRSLREYRGAFNCLYSRT